MASPFRALIPLTPKAIETRYECFASDCGYSDCSSDMSGLAVYDYATQIPCGGTVHFGSTAPGYPVYVTLTISNTGLAPIRIDGFRITGTGFTVTNTFTGWFMPGVCGEVLVELTAAQIGTYTAVLSVDSSSPVSPCNIDLIGSVSPTAPTITDPQSELSCNAGNAWFSVNATGDPSPTYQWSVSTNGGSTWSNITDVAPYSGSHTNVLSITAPTIGMNGYKYRCTATNMGGSATSAAATLSCGVAPSVTAAATIIPHEPAPPPDCPDITVGQLTATASGVGPLTYQWQYSNDGGSTYLNFDTTHHPDTWNNSVTGYYTPVLNYYPGRSTPPGSHYCRCVVTNACGSTTSNRVNTPGFPSCD